jgi:hypothetical protein
MFLIVLSRTLALARKELATLFAAGWGYMLLLVALNAAISLPLMPEAGFATGSYMVEPIAAGDEVRTVAWRGLAIVANVLAGFSIGVAYLRRVLLGRREFFLAFGARNVWVAWKLAVLGLIGALLFLPILFAALLLTPLVGPLAAILVLASPFLVILVVQRLSLVLPAIALDDDLSLGDAWRLSQGFGLALMVAAIAIWLLAAVLGFTWYFLLGVLGLVAPDTQTLAVLHSALFPMGAMVIVTWLYSSLLATSYALARERFAEKVGLELAERERAEAVRARAHKQRAAAAVSSVRDLSRGRRRGGNG